SYSRFVPYGALSMNNRSHPAKGADFSGVDSQWHTIEHRSAAQGRPISAMDNQQHRPVAMVDKKARDDLKLDADPSGAIINVQYFGRIRIVGLLEDQQTMEGGSGNGQVVVPFDFTTARFHWPIYYQVMMTARSADVVEDAKAELEYFLRQKRGLKYDEENNFRI